VYDRLINNMRDGAVIYVSHSDTERVNFTREFTRAGFKLSQNLIWNKQSATLSRQDYNWKHESILFGWKPGALTTSLMTLPKELCLSKMILILTK
jgi:DNA modification methylase